MIIEDKLWAGTEAGYHAAIRAEAEMVARVSTHETDAENETPRLLSIEDGLATIEIKGSLVNGSHPFMRYFGVTGYGEIREALMAAAEDPEVKQILLEVDSGGGAVAGVADTGKLIRTINDRVKPVTTYSDTMASAAYWLGASAGEVFSSQTSLVGSIGVLAVHREYSEQNKMEGVGVTVVRAGKEKALANSNEKLSEKGKAQIQQMVDASYKVFVEHVADMRGKSYEYADQSMAQGKEFIGQAALDVGLIDGIDSYDAVVSRLKEKIVAQSENLIDNRGRTGNGSFSRNASTSNGDIMAKKALTEQAIAALAAGASLEAATGGVVEAAAATEPVQAPETTEPAAAVEPTKAPEVPSQVDNLSATVQLLNSQLQAKDGALLQAGIKAAKLEEQLNEAKATHGPLIEIAAKTIGNMQIAMGGSPMSLEGLSAVAVLAEHKRYSEQFQKRYPVGGVSAVSSTQDAGKKDELVMTNVMQAQIRAVNGK